MSELQRFVLNFLEVQGGIVEPAGPATFDVLMPESTADALGTGSLHTWAFEDPGVPNADVNWLTLNTPLVERMIDTARANPTAAHYVVDSVRLNKSSLADLAKAAWLIPNARLSEPAGSTAVRILNSYLLFNFKVALLSDDKQEQMASVLMDVQGGYALRETDAGQILMAARPIAEADAQLGRAVGLVRWRIDNQKEVPPPHDIKTLSVLLERAQAAVADVLAEPIKRLQKRSARFLALDEARLNAYYDEIEQDLRMRAERAAGERVANLQAKLALTAAERQTKLADAAARYQVRAELALINVMLIQQPKLAQPLQLQNRKTQRDLIAVYDPLLHRIEPLLCEVCHLPGQRLQLCQNGHLAHAHCLAPQCVDCKRVYCSLCTAEVGSCSVCHQPLCHASAIGCSVCERSTCQAHRNLCHADQRSPVDLTQVQPKQQPEPDLKRPKTSSPPTKRAPKPRPKGTSQLRRSAEKPPAWPKGVPKPQRIEVMIDHEKITAFLLASREREVATRWWSLSAERAIQRRCRCEKGDKCEADGYILRPFQLSDLRNQIQAEIEAFRKEYGFPSKKVTYMQGRGPYSPPIPLRQFVLPERWLDEALLDRAREAFDYFADFGKWPTP